jgi:hypothetical protein
LITEVIANNLITFKPNRLIKKKEGNTFGETLIDQYGNSHLFDWVIWANGHEKAQKSSKETYAFLKTYFINSVDQPLKEVQIHLFRRPFKMSLVLCPMPNGEVNVELGISHKKASELNLKTIFSKLIATYPNTLSYFNNATERTKAQGIVLNLHSTKRVYQNNNSLYIGDASGLVNPVTGYGVGHAMWLAQQAAIYLHKHVINPSKADMSFEQIAKNGLEKEVKISALLNTCINNLGLISFFLRIKPIRFWLSKKMSRPDFANRLK